MKLIAECLRKVIDEAAGGGTGFCVTLEAARDADSWAQLTWDSLNFAYPLATEPRQALAERGIELPEIVEVSAWEAGKFVTFDHGAEPIDGLVEFIEAYMRGVLGIEPEAKSLSVKWDSL